MKKYCAIFLFALITKYSFCMDLRNKRQVNMTSKSDLDDRFGWSGPIIRQRWPTPNDNLNSNHRTPLPNQPGSPINRPFPIESTHPSGVPFSYEGRYPIGGTLPNQGRYPIGGTFPNQGRYPIVGTFPNQGRYPIVGTFPNQGRYPIVGTFPNQGRYPIGGIFPNPLPFPNQGRFPFDSSNQGFFPTWQPTTRKPINRSTTPAPNSSSVRDCLQNCSVTSEYNPVCGTDNVTYPNPGRLICAQACGISVRLLRSSPCPSI